MFVDHLGVTRHALSPEYLKDLYKRLDDFGADCTVEEYEEAREAFAVIRTMLHQRLRNNAE